MTNSAGVERLRRLVGGAVLALDGNVGAVRDFYFDDDTWTVRYIVVETGKWLQGRLVLVPLWTLHTPDWDQCQFPIKLTRKQLKHGPDIDTHQPVSRTAEAVTLAYYGYPVYWTWPARRGPTTGSDSTLIAARRLSIPAPHGDTDATHLQSCRKVIGYRVCARGREIGHVDDLVIDPRTWGVVHILINMGNCADGCSVLISPTSVRRVSRPDRLVEVSVSRDAIACSPSLERVI